MNSLEDLKLDLGKANVKDDDYLNAAKEIAKLPKLKKLDLDLSYNDITNKFVEEILFALQNSETLEELTLDLRINQITANGVILLLKYLKNRKIKKVEIDLNNN